MLCKGGYIGGTSISNLNNPCTIFHISLWRKLSTMTRLGDVNILREISQATFKIVIGSRSLLSGRVVSSLELSEVFFGSVGGVVIWISWSTIPIGRTEFPIIARVGLLIVIGRVIGTIWKEGVIWPIIVGAFSGIPEVIWFT